MKREIRVMHVVKGLRLAGLEKVVTSLILAMSGFTQMVCVEEKYEGPLVENLEEELIAHNIKIIHMNRPENKAQRMLPFHYMGLFKRENINIVHTHSGVWRDAFLGGKLAGVPIHFHTEHGMSVNGNGKVARFTYRLLTRLSSQVICVSKNLEQALVAEFGMNPRKFCVIHNGVDMNLFKPSIPKTDLRKELHIADDEKIIGTVGRIVPLKDHKTLVRAFAIVQYKFPRCRLVIVGREDTALIGIKQEIINVAEELGVQDKVTFTGERPDVPNILNLFDVFVLSSLTEGISISLLEAAAAGNPVVATSVGGNPEIVEDGKSGFLVPPRDPESLADRLLQFLKNDSLRIYMGKAGRTMVEKKFSLPAMTEKYHSLYESFLEKVI